MGLETLSASSASAMNRVSSNMVKAITGYYRLKDFIHALRACKTLAAERALIAKESFAIRTAFKEESGPDQRYHSIAKLLYIHLLGYPAHFGQVECLKLAASPRLTDKRLGYLGVVLLIDEQQQTLTLVTNSLKSDLNSPSTTIVGLALSTLASVGSVEIAYELADEVDRLLGSSNPYLRKKAAFCACRLMEKVPELAEQFEGRVNSLISDRNHAVVLGGISLALELVKLNPSCVLPMLRRTLVPSLVRLLQGLLGGGSSGYSLEHDVSGLNDPFLQVQILRLLRALGRGDVEASDMMVDVLTQLAAGLDGSRNVGQAVLYEGLLTIFSIKADASLRTMAVGLLARLLTQQGTDNNLRYVSLNLLNKVLQQQTTGTIEVIERHRETVLRCLDDPDVSIRRRATDVALALVSRSSIRETFARLEASLLGPDADAELATSLIPRLAVLAARFAPNSRWYVDTLRSLLGHESVASKEELVSTFVRIINNTEDVQAYATKSLLRPDLLQSDQSEGLVQATAWCLGEYGHCIDVPSGVVLGRLLGWLRTPNLSPQTMAYVISALGKLSVRFPAALSQIQAGLREASQRRSDEAAQKAAETLALVSNAALRALVFSPIPSDPKYTIGSDDVMATGQLLGPTSAIDRSESPAPVLDIFAELATLSLDGLGSPPSRAPSSAHGPSAPFGSALASPKQDHGKACYDSHGLQIFLRPVTDNAPVDALLIQLTAHNKLSAPITGLQILAAVPKILKVLLDPASGSQIAPSGTVKQLLRVSHATSDESASTILSMLKLRLRLSFTPPLSAQSITETVEVTSIL